MKFLTALVMAGVLLKDFVYVRMGGRARAARRESAPIRDAMTTESVLTDDAFALTGGRGYSVTR